MSQRAVKFTKACKWSIGREIKNFEKGDVYLASVELAEEMVTHNYAEYTDLTKAVKVEENKAIESVEDLKEAAEEPAAENEVEQEAVPSSEDPLAEAEAEAGADGGPEAEEEVKPEVKKTKKKKGKKASKK